MSAAADHRRSTADRVLPMRARGDLQVVEVAFAGEPSYVVKDPVAGETFHLTSEEHALLDAMRQPISLRGLQRLIESQFAPRRASIPQLQHFVNRLYEQGLLVGETVGQGAELLARGRDQTRRERRASLLQLLSIRLGRIDAGPIIDRLYAAFSWACSRPALLLAVALILYALLLAIGSAPQLIAQMPGLDELTRPTLAPIWIAAIAAVKVLHELGHALACRHFGARPQEMGLLLLAGVPSLYCDVSDAWRLPSKWQRMAVSGAGMFVELVIASIAVILWSVAEPGLVRTLCLSLIIVCSVGTLLLNANPLLRYDGYYLLSDWLEAPNLAERARGLVSGAWRRWLLGEPRQHDSLLGPHKRRALWVYSVLSKLYLALVLVGLFMLALKLARPYHLQNAVYTLAAVVVAGLLVQPVASATRLAANPAVRGRFRWLRLGLTVMVLGALMAGVLLIPITHRVKAPLILIPANTSALFAVAEGELEFAAPVGAEVNAGDVVARLRNPELELALLEQQGAVREHRTRLYQLRTLQAVLPAAARLLPTTMAELADAEAQLAEHQAMVDALVIRAPAAGRIFAPPDRTIEPTRGDTLLPWSGSPLAERNRGAWIERGTPLAVIAQPGGWVAWAGVEQADIPTVEQGQAVRLIADQQPTEILTGRVREVARRARSNRSEASPPPAGGSPLSDPWYHVVEIELDAPPPLLIPGARGIAKIDAYRSTIGALVLNQLRRTFQRVF